MNNLIELSNINKIFVTQKKISVLKKINFKFKKGKISRKEMEKALGEYESDDE